MSRGLTETELHFLSDINECPFCCGKIFRFGPRGGASVNMFCVQCDAGFNLLITIEQYGQLIQAPKEER